MQNSCNLVGVIAVKEVKEKSAWERINLKDANPTFLQSWAWGDFQKSLGRKVYRLGIHENADLLGISLLVEEKARIASLLYCPGGPVVPWEKKYLDPWLAAVSKIAKERNLDFLRVDPRRIEKPAKEVLKDLRFSPAPGYTQPQCTGIIDLTKSEDEILLGMSPSTRNNVRASQRKGVAVREGNPDEIKTFLELLSETAKRKGLVLPRAHGYHQKQFEALNGDGLVKLFIAEGRGQALASSLVVFYADTAYYLHAAGSGQMPKLRASYPLVWRSIQEAKNRNLTRFDFWGVAENDDPSHPWAGVTSFKLSFGARRECYAPPYDLPYKGSYRLIRFLETARRPLRKLLKLIKRFRSSGRSGDPAEVRLRRDEGGSDQ